jgi:hypothetical protein
MAGMYGQFNTAQVGRIDASGFILAHVEYDIGCICNLMYNQKREKTQGRKSRARIDGWTG